MDVKVRNDTDPIIMVDDNEDDIYLAVRCHQRSGLKNPIQAFMGGEDFIEYMMRVAESKEALPVLVLLDINMPGMTGFDVLAHVRARPEFQIVPVIVMLTNSDNPRDVDKATDMGADGYKNKPASIDDYVSFFASIANG